MHEQITLNSGSGPGDGPSEGELLQPDHPGARGDMDVARLAVLRVLTSRPDISQRELSAELGLSLGKTHFVLHALLDKGLVKVRNFQRSHRKLAYAYVLTPRGFSEKLRLTQRFLVRKEAEYQALARTIAQLKHELDNHEAAPPP